MERPADALTPADAFYLLCLRSTRTVIIQPVRVLRMVSVIDHGFFRISHLHCSKTRPLPRPGWPILPGHTGWHGAGCFCPNVLTLDQTNGDVVHFLCLKPGGIAFQFPCPSILISIFNITFILQHIIGENPKY